MAITIGTTKSNSGSKANSTNFTFTHTVDADTKCLVVVIESVDPTSTDAVCNSIKWDVAGVNESFTASGTYSYRVGGNTIIIGYLSIPSVLSSKLISVAMAGANAQIQAHALNLVDASASSIVYDSFATGSANPNGSGVVNPAASGSYAIGGAIADGGLPASFSVTTGTEVPGSELDMGSDVASAAYAAESGGSATITWTYTTALVSCLVQTFKGVYGSSAIKTINGLAYASVKTKNGLAVASIKTVNGLA